MCFTHQYPAVGPSIWALWQSAQKSSCPHAGSRNGPRGDIRQTDRGGAGDAPYCSAHWLTSPRAPGTCSRHKYLLIHENNAKCSYLSVVFFIIIVGLCIYIKSRCENAHLLSSNGCRAVRFEQTDKFSLLRLLMMRGLLSKHSCRKRKEMQADQKRTKKKT